MKYAINPGTKGGRPPKRQEISLADLEALGISPELLGTMKPAELLVLNQCLHEMAEAGTSPTAATLLMEDYKWEPVSIEQFIHDPYYMGKFSDGFFPAIKAKLIEIFDAENPPNELLLTGGIGYGKSVICAIVVTYYAYRMSCLRDPHAFYKLARGNDIYFSIFSLNLDQAEDGVFGKVRNWIDQIPYFEQRCPRIKRTNSEIKFSGCPLHIIPASKTSHTIGKDVSIFLLDEANFVDGDNDSKNSAYSIYTNMLARLQSRFTINGKNVGLAILASSRASKASFLDQHIKDQSRQIAKGSTALIAFSSWEVRPASEFTKPKFQVEIGDRINPSRILEKDESPREGSQSVWVPGEYLQRFEDDLDGAIRDLAGISTESMMPLFHNKRIILDCSDAGHRHPFTRDEIVIDVLKDDKIDNYFLPEAMFKTQQSAYAMRLNPGCPRYVHIDIGYASDALGMTMLHIAGFRTLRRERRDGTWYLDRVPVVVVDFVLRIIPPKGSETDISCARSFLLSLRDYGVPIVRVSYDSHQSKTEVQTLKKMGFDAVVLSVDRTDEAYLGLRQMYAEKRISHYPHAVLFQELSALERDVDKRKVDHPKGGSKDLADSMAGAAFLAAIDKRPAIAAMIPNLDPADAPIRKSDGTLGPKWRPKSLITGSAIAIPGGEIQWNALDAEAGLKPPSRT